MGVSLKEVGLIDGQGKLVWLEQIIRQAINTQISPNNIVITDSFPLSLCQSVR